MIELVLAAAAAYMGHSGCVHAAHDRILVSDVATAIPVFRSDSEGPEFIGWTPVPGTRRVITAKELLQASRRRGLPVSDGDVREVCVERAVSPLGAARIMGALAHLPELDGAQIEIVDFSRISVPEGHLEFSMAGLGRPAKGDAEAAVLWRGRFVYDERRTMPVWVRVKLTRVVTAMRAVRNIAAGSEISAEMVEAASMNDFSGSTGERVSSAAEVVGKRAVHGIRAGDVIDKRWLGEPELISPGQKVRVTVESGSVRLSFDREAASAGQPGKPVLLRDKTSGRTLRAETTGRGAALIRVTPENRI